MSDIERILAEICALAEKATPGPWAIGHRDNRVLNIADCLFTHSKSPHKSLPSGDQSADNAAFIAAARTDVPRLVATLREALEILDASKATKNHLARILTGESDGH